MHGVGGGFEGVDLGDGELVGGGLVPVGLIHGGGRVEGEAGGFDFGLPVGAGGKGDSVHAVSFWLHGSESVLGGYPPPPLKYPKYVGIKS